MKNYIVVLAVFLWGSSVFGSELLNTINQERTKRGLPKLIEKSELNCAATKQATYIGSRKICSHTGSGGTSPGDRIKACGLRPLAWGEIVACGQRTPRAAVDAWIKSPGHNAIMFSKTYKYFGGAMSNYYWAVVFTK